MVSDVSFVTFFSWTPSPRRRPGDEFNGHGPNGPTGPMDFVRQEFNRFGRGPSKSKILIPPSHEKKLINFRSKSFQTFATKIIFCTKRRSLAEEEVSFALKKYLSKIIKNQCNLKFH